MVKAAATTWWGPVPMFPCPQAWGSLFFIFQYSLFYLGLPYFPLSSRERFGLRIETKHTKKSEKTLKKGFRPLSKKLRFFHFFPLILVCLIIKNFPTIFLANFQMGILWPNPISSTLFRDYTLAT